MKVTRLNGKIVSDSRRVILQFFQMNETRTRKIINRVLYLPEVKVDELLTDILYDFNSRHRNLEILLHRHFHNVEKYLPGASKISRNRELLIGAYFSKEYSIESAALFNPSIVPHPDQHGAGENELRFIMSLRATGEGHISSIEFREGIISNTGVTVTSPGSIVSLPLITGNLFSKKELVEKTKNKNLFSAELFNQLEEDFTVENWKAFLTSLDKKNIEKESLNLIDDEISSNYDAQFEAALPVSERVLFPFSKSEIMGMEDARFVKFIYENSNTAYYGTYTAYNGRTFRTQLIETEDFVRFRIRSLHGKGINDKGLALFPRKINDKFFMVSRQDGENIFIMNSSDLHYWEASALLLEPSFDWEFVQLGNCGSPLETEEGWLLITHAVGPFRKYVISAVLLDLQNPSKIIGRLNTPLFSPNRNEREGYVPNVVYSCGSLIHNGEVIIPYAMSDAATGFAMVNLKKLLNRMIYFFHV